MINKTRLLNTLLELLKIDGPALCERPVSDYLKKYFKEIELDLEEDDTGSKIDGNSGNLYLHMHGIGDSSVAFLAHMDTVKPTFGLEPIVTDNNVRSNGKTVLGADDRLGIALLCELVKYLKESKIKHCPIEIIFTVAEEIGLFGIKNIDYNRIKSKIAFVLDAGGSCGKIVSKAPSLERMNITVKGKASHAGSSPEKGVNAIAIAAKAISNIKQGRVDQDTTLNIGKIEGGTATNIVSDKVKIEGEARSFNPSTLTEQIKNAEVQFLTAADEFGGSIEFDHKLSFSTFNLDKESQPVKMAVSAAEKKGIPHKITHTGGGSDANILNAHGIISAGLGIGYFEEHTNNEYISLKDMYNSLEWLIEICSVNLE